MSVNICSVVVYDERQPVSSGLCDYYIFRSCDLTTLLFRFENMTASTMTFLVPGFIFFFVIQLAGAMEEISISQNSTLKNHTVSSWILYTYLKSADHRIWRLLYDFFNRSEKVCLFLFAVVFIENTRLHGVWRFLKTKWRSN